jgi:hypothetical protein
MPMETYAGRSRPVAHTSRERLGGTEGNEILTAAIGAILTALLIAEGITIIWIGGLLSVHMFIGLVLVPPLLVKLASTGYRFVRYYTHSRPYVRRGPPALPMRLMAPILVATTIGVFATGVWLLLLGHKSDQMLFFHKLFFFVWAAVFAIHFLIYAPRVLSSLRSDWRSARRHAVPGSGLRGMLVAASVGAGAALAASLLSTIGAWHG